MKIGAVLFDDPYVAKEGWASSGEEAMRINGHGELDSDTLWVTNVPFPKWRELTLNNTSNILHSQYMRTTIEHISKELNIVGDPINAVKAAASIYNGAVEYGQKNYDVSILTPGYRYSNLVADRVFPSHMRSSPDIVFRTRLMNAFKESTQENQAMSAKQVPSGSSIYSFVFPRGTYAKWLLNMPVPVGTKWKEIKKSQNTTTIGVREGEVVKGTKAVVKKLMGMGEDNALFLKVVVKYTDRAYRNFASFGNGSNHIRSWVTLPELLTLIKYSVVELHGGFMTELGYLNVTQEKENETEFSYSKGIFMDNLWISLATPKYRDKYTAVGAYLRAYDRAMCFKVAESMVMDHGFTVGSYGAGRIQTYLREGELPYAIEAGLNSNVIPQLCMKTDGVNDEH